MYFGTLMWHHKETYKFIYKLYKKADMTNDNVVKSKNN